MPKTAFVFPGQGTQYPGMGWEAAQKFPLVREYFQRTDAVLGFSLSKLCWEGPAEKLTLTQYAQPAILTLSTALAALIENETGLVPHAAAGLSLGEYSALVSAGMIELETAVSLVSRRGKYIQDAVPIGTGAMAAIFGLDSEQVRTLCFQAEGIVEPANFNCHGQIVVSGEKAAVNNLAAAVLKMEACRIKNLDVSAPFHCSLLKPAAEWLEADLKEIEFKKPRYIVLSNVDAKPLTIENVREKLTQQVTNPVLWQQCVENLAEMGCTAMVEPGPGRVLSALIRKIRKDLTVANIETPADLANLRRD